MRIVFPFFSSGGEERKEYFLREYNDILVKVSKNVRKLHGNLQTILREYEVWQRNRPTSDFDIFVDGVNSLVTQLNDLANKIYRKMDSNVTTGETSFRNESDFDNIISSYNNTYIFRSQKKSCNPSMEERIRK